MELKKIHNYLHHNNWNGFNEPTLFIHNEINQAELDTFLNNAKNLLNLNSIKPTQIKRTYSVLVEGLENAARHKVSNDNKKVYCSLELNNTQIDVYIANTVGENEEKKINLFFTETAKLNTTEIKKRIQLKTTDKQGLSNKNGAGVGIYLLHTKCQNIQHSFINIDNNKYLILQFTIH
jgi:hypothetical protein